jgi:hypothetical protein
MVPKQRPRKVCSEILQPNLINYYLIATWYRKKRKLNQSVNFSFIISGNRNIRFNCPLSYLIDTINKQINKREMTGVVLAYLGFLLLEKINCSKVVQNYQSIDCTVIVASYQSNTFHIYMSSTTYYSQ